MGFSHIFLYKITKKYEKIKLIIDFYFFLYIYICMDTKEKKEKKTEDINIRIENSIKISFKQHCLKENKTMSEKIIDFILKEIEKE